MKLRYGLLLIAGSIIGCDSDGIQDLSYDDQMIREALCVVASERFQLHDEAKRHYDHGIDAGRFRFDSTGKENDFVKQVQDARSITVNMSKQYHARILINQCNTELTQAQFNRGA